MPTNRIGFSSDFVLNNSRVGIATTNPSVTLQVAGVAKGDYHITGVSTLASYGGFVSQKQNISLASTVGFTTTGIGTVGITSFIKVNEAETGFVSLVGEFNTLSEDLIVDDGRIFDVSTIRNIGITTIGTQNVYVPTNTSVSLGTLENVIVGSHFSVPNSGISSRPQNPTEGMVRFNNDLNTLEFYNGDEWRQFTVTGASGRGVFGGGDTPTRVSTIDFVNIQSTGNAINFGNLTVARSDVSLGVCASSTRGMFVGGGPGSLPNLNVIDYVTIASEGNAIDFGDTTQTTAGSASCSSSTRGVFGGGGTPTLTNVIDYISIATIGNALDFGDLTVARSTFTGLASPTRGLFGGGVVPTVSDRIDFVTISSTGNAVTFGNLTQARRAVSACANTTRGVFMGGSIPGYVKTVDYITIASTGNALTFGELTTTQGFGAPCGSQTRGLTGGGYDGSTIVNTINFITISTTGNAQDFGDLTQARNNPQGTSDSHGGLGGF